MLYLDDAWTPVEPEQATQARVLFDDGVLAFYQEGPVTKAPPTANEDNE